MTILITGANRGIGHGLFERYRILGEDVIGTTRGDPDAEGEGRWLPLDVTDPASVAGLGTALQGTALEVLVCNAGVYPDRGERLEDGFPPAMWAQAFAVNVTGVFLTVQAALPALRRGTAPKIAILSSTMASDARAPGGAYVYRASKAAALNIGRNLAADLRDCGIAVGIFHPGWVRTEMGTGAADLSVDQVIPGLTERFRQLALDTTGTFEAWDGRPIPF